MHKILRFQHPSDVDSRSGNMMKISLLVTTHPYTDGCMFYSPEMQWSRCDYGLSSQGHITLMLMASLWIPHLLVIRLEIYGIWLIAQQRASNTMAYYWELFMQLIMLFCFPFQEMLDTEHPCTLKNTWSMLEAIRQFFFSILKEFASVNRVEHK